MQAARLSFKLIIAILFGIACGLFFGEYSSYLKPIGTIYVMMLQSVVYPYLISSLIWGFGQMSSQRAKTFFKNTWAIYLVLIVIVFIVLFCLVSAIPVTASRIIDMVSKETLSDFWQNILNILVPENPFEAVVKNFIPAVIIISILYGIALQNFKNKNIQLQFFEMISKTSIQIWNWVIKFSPIGVFALIADFSGNIDISKLEGALLYFFLYFLGALFITFCLLPFILKSIYPLPYREVLGGLQNALIISCVTMLSVAALPFIAEMVRKLLKRHQIETEENEEIIQTSLSISYPLCQFGNAFIYVFIFFAAYYFHREIGLREKLFLPFLTFISSIGTPSTAINSVDLLSKWVDLPKESLSLYVLFIPITRFAQVLVSVMGMSVFTILSCLAYFNKLQFNLRSLLSGLAFLVGFVLIFLGLNDQFRAFTGPQEPNLLTFHIDEDLKKNVEIEVFEGTSQIPAETYDPTSSVLHAIKERGVLRVGYNLYMIPWSYFNQDHELVGYDVTMMYKLAKDLHVKLEFLPFDWPELVQNIEEGKFDIAISSIYVTADRLQKVKFSNPYDSSKTSLIVRNDKISNFYSLQDILKHKDDRIAVFEDPITIPLALLNFPKEQIVIVKNYHTLPPEVDAALWTKSHTDAWVTIHPGFTSIVPEGLIQGWPLQMAYMLNKNAEDFLEFINYWMKLQASEGFSQGQYDYWIRRILPKEKTPRWSVIHNVLHWVD